MAAGKKHTYYRLHLGRFRWQIINANKLVFFDHEKSAEMAKVVRRALPLTFVGQHAKVRWNLCGHRSLLQACKRNFLAKYAPNRAEMKGIGWVDTHSYIYSFVPVTSLRQSHYWYVPFIVVKVSVHLAKRLFCGSSSLPAIRFFRRPNNVQAN